MPNSENTHHPAEGQSHSHYRDFIESHPDVMDAVERVKVIQKKRAAGDSSFNEYSTTEGYLGIGDEKVVYRSGEFAVKILHERDTTGYSFDDQTLALSRGKDISGLEQLLCSDKESRMIVTDLAPGDSIVKIPSSKLIRSIKRDHIVKLQNTLAEMQSRGLHYDNVKNVLFDPVEGFTIIDYRTLDEDGHTYDPNDKNAPIYYQEMLKDLEIDNFIDAITESRHKEISGMYSEHGENISNPTPRLIGRVALKLMIRSKTKF